MSADYSVRPALIADWPKLAAITQACDLDVPGISCDAYTGIVLVAEHAEDGVVGFVQCLPSAPACVVTDMAILPGHRKRGLVPLLGAHLEYVLTELGYRAWVAFVRGDRNDNWRDVIKKWGAEEAPMQGYFFRRILPNTERAISA